MLVCLSQARFVGTGGRQEQPWPGEAIELAGNHLALGGFKTPSLMLLAPLTHQDGPLITVCVCGGGGGGGDGKNIVNIRICI